MREGLPYVLKVVGKLPWLLLTTCWYPSRNNQNCQMSRTTIILDIFKGFVLFGFFVLIFCYYKYYLYGILKRFADSNKGGISNNVWEICTAKNLWKFCPFKYQLYRVEIQVIWTVKPPTMKRRKGS